MPDVGRLLHASVLATAFLGGCGAHATLPASCRELRPEEVLRALRDAPGDVALRDGTRISTCVERALGDADLQRVGAALTTAADRLADRMASSDAAALQLGYLIGATARGADATAGVQRELSDRVAGAAGLDGGPAARRGALARGRRAGRRGG
jgi:hypothetical protein